MSISVDAALNIESAEQYDIYVMYLRQVYWKLGLFYYNLSSVVNVPVALLAHDA